MERLKQLRQASSPPKGALSKPLFEIHRESLVASGVDEAKARETGLLMDQASCIDAIMRLRDHKRGKKPRWMCPRILVNFVAQSKGKCLIFHPRLARGGSDRAEEREGFFFVYAGHTYCIHDTKQVEIRRDKAQGCDYLHVKGQK
jgi:hypothetical protein